MDIKRLSILALVVWSFGAMPALAKGPTIVVRGQGEVEVVPDIASVTVEVSSRDNDPERAQALNVETTKKLYLELQKSGIAPSDMGSTRYYFKRDVTRNTDGAMIDNGFYAENSVQIKIHKFENTPRLIAVAVANGATSVGDVQYTLNDDKPYIDKARAEAFQDAKTEAKKIAAATNMRLGRITAISIGDAYISQVDAASDFSKSEGEADIPAASLEPLITPGTVRVSYSVTIEYELR